MELINSARQYLADHPAHRDSVDRQEIVAYALLSAFRDHFPEEVSEEDLRILEKWKFIREVEYSRFVKQRRVALATLARAWTKGRSFSFKKDF